MTNMKNLPHTKTTESMSAHRKPCRGIAASRLSFNNKNDGSDNGSNSGVYYAILGGSGNSIAVG